MQMVLYLYSLYLKLILTTMVKIDGTTEYIELIVAAGTTTFSWR